MFKCPVCGAEVKVATWVEVVKERKTNEVRWLALQVKYDEATDTFELDEFEKRFPEEKYALYSFSPEEFAEGEVAVHYGAHCHECNADL